MTWPGPDPEAWGCAGVAGLVWCPWVLVVPVEPHYQFADYGKLTVIGVVIACVAWPVTTRISSDPRWLFLRMAVLVTLVLLLPDVYIWAQGQSGQAVAVLMVMHVAIGVVAYEALVRLAPARAAVPQQTRSHRDTVASDR